MYQPQRGTHHSQKRHEPTTTTTTTHEPIATKQQPTAVTHEPNHTPPPRPTRESGYQQLHHLSIQDTGAHNDLDGVGAKLRHLARRVIPGSLGRQVPFYGRLDHQLRPHAQHHRCRWRHHVLVEHGLTKVGRGRMERGRKKESKETFAFPVPSVQFGMQPMSPAVSRVRTDTAS